MNYYNYIFNNFNYIEDIKNSSNIGVYLCGSRCHKWLNNPNDYDFIFFYNENINDIEKNILRNIEKDCKCLLDDYIIRDIKTINSWDILFGQYYIFVCGSDIFKPVNILTNKNLIKEKLIEEYNYYIYKDNPRKLSKRGYDYIYCNFIFKNSSLTLTEEQIKILNEWHDNTNRDNKFLNKCLKELNMPFKISEQ